MSRRLNVTELTPASFRRTRVWEYTDDDASGNAELAVQPVSATPVLDTRNRLIGVDVRLADGSALPAMLANLDPRDAAATQHFLTVSVWTGERWFHLARYHDITYKRDGPAALAAALGRTVAEVFPIGYDVTDIVVGEPAALRGEIVAEPTERLSRAELIARAVRSG
jgi:hypothetical protein